MVGGGELRSVFHRVMIADAVQTPLGLLLGGWRSIDDIFGRAGDAEPVGQHVVLALTDRGLASRLGGSRLTGATAARRPGSSDRNTNPAGTQQQQF
jgi:hypothetical protein